MKTGRQACCCVITVSLTDLRKWTYIYIFAQVLCLTGRASASSFEIDAFFVQKKPTKTSDLISFDSFPFQTSVTIKRFVRLTAPHR